MFFFFLIPLGFRIKTLDCARYTSFYSNAIATEGPATIFPDGLECHNRPPALVGLALRMLKNECFWQWR